MLLNSNSRLLHFWVLFQALENVTPLVRCCMTHCTRWCLCGSGTPTLLLSYQWFKRHEISRTPRLSILRRLAFLQSTSDIIACMIILVQRDHLFLCYFFFVSFLLLLLLIWALTDVWHLPYWPLFIKVIVDGKLIHDVFALWHGCVFGL